MIIMKGIANPSTLPLINAALFHSTPFLQLRFKLVSKKYDKNETSGNWRAQPQTQSSNLSKKSAAGDISNRQALGLNATGPLTLDQVKIAYRQSAMKWHPDHHQGVDKALAEATFKKINAAHESLCNELSGP